jgi:hypothetical protein
VRSQLDRYFGRPAHRDASVTVLAAEGVDQVAAELGTGPLDPLATRRNAVLRLGPAVLRCAEPLDPARAGPRSGRPPGERVPRASLHRATASGREPITASIGAVAIAADGVRPTVTGR